MSGRGNVVEWVETTEEVVASEETTEEVITSEECPPDTGNSSTVLTVIEHAEAPIHTVIEHAEAPIHKLLDTMVQGEDQEVDDGFYCVECRDLFQDQAEFHGIDGPSFILDSPTEMGLPQRALLTLPHGLMIGRSSIPGAGLGVINQGPTMSPGMHFGPYEGEAATRELALQSDFSWEIFKGKEEYEYIDAARDSHSNWMRYVNCARSEGENNLLVVQCKDSILFHCCRSIQPGDELMVWPSARLLAHFSHAWTQIWFLKCTPTDGNTAVASQIFLCAHCQLSFTTEAYLQRHTDCFHLPPVEDCAPPDAEEAEAVEPGPPPPPPTAADPDGPHQASLLVLTIDPAESKTCPDCGRIFKHSHHLKRHQLSVHSNERPYCCTQCRRCFSQASGLLRHQMVHRKHSPVKTIIKTEADTERRAIESGAAAGQTKESASGPTDAQDPAESTQEEPGTRPNIPRRKADENPNASQENSALSQQNADSDPNTPQENSDLSQQGADTDPNAPQGSSEEISYKCSQCTKIFTCEASLTKHERSVHSKLRPYVCTLCRKGFKQYSDLTRHLKIHQRGKERKIRNQAAGNKQTAATFVTVYCDKCRLTFSSEDSLQLHVNQHHPEEMPQEAPVAVRERSPSPCDDRDPDPDFIPPPSLAKAAGSSQRPQRLGARAKISAITKLIAPKRRLSVRKTTSRSPARAEESCSEAEAPDASTRTTDGEAKAAKLDLKAHKGAKKRHHCAQCRSTFKSSGFLKRHERMVHSAGTPYTCERCSRTFSKVCNLKQHQKANSCDKHHCSSELFCCPFCQFSFTMKSYLRKHVMRHHPVEYLSHSESDLQKMCDLGEEDAKESYNCPHCGKTYVNAKYFKAHVCFKQVRILYLCTDCGKGFSNHYSLRQHQRIHTGEKPYSCPHCSKSFSYMGQVNVHIRTHTGEKPYLCTHCGESFRQSGDLKRHERKHTGVRPYSCPEAGCFKSFSRPQSLKAHQMLHLGQRMFKCTQCGKSFSRNYHLRRHHQKMHS